MNQSKSRIGVCTVNVNVSTYSSRYKDLKVKVKMLEEYGDEVVVKPIDILTPNLDSYELSEASNNLSDKIVIKKSKVTWANYSKDIVLDVDDIMLLLNGEELTFNDSKIKAKKGITTNELLDMIINKV